MSALDELQGMVERFGERWGPRRDYAEFISDLRDLLEAYGKTALVHESAPDTEHEHGGAT
jgi:hypothetical protein